MVFARHGPCSRLGGDRSHNLSGERRKRSSSSAASRDGRRGHRRLVRTGFPVARPAYRENRENERQITNRSAHGSYSGWNVLARSSRRISRAKCSRILFRAMEPRQSRGLVFSGGSRIGQRVTDIGTRGGDAVTSVFAGPTRQSPASSAASSVPGKVRPMAYRYTHTHWPSSASDRVPPRAFCRSRRRSVPCVLLPEYCRGTCSRCRRPG
jgi:hypothetical protein